ncbi:MAG: class I SAM-dependent methyltransferase [Verrucomicrobia bacterium]|nr:class I SAM-dependent methyltransferase [Verrucomicrobiota bacterium]
MNALISRIRRVLFGYEFSQLPDVMAAIEASQKMNKRLEAKVTRLEELLTLAGDQPKTLWIYANRSERMDANLPFFEEGRREFHLERYRFASQYVNGRDVADIACGTGYGAALLVQSGRAKCVTGVDIDHDAVSYATDVYGAGGVAFVCASAEATGFEAGCVDVVTSFETIEHLENEQGLLAEFARILRPSGHLIISTPNQWPCAAHPHHVREYDRESLRDALGTHFKVRELYNQNSGGAGEFNRGQARGIVPTTDENHYTAECFIAVCEKV